MCEFFIKIFLLSGFFLVPSLQNSEMIEEEMLSMMKELHPDNWAEFVDEVKMAGEILKFAIDAEDKGDYKAALTIWNKMAQLAELEYGPEDPKTIAALIHKLRMYNVLEDWNEAFPLAWKIYNVQEKTLGKEHEDTIKAMIELGNVYSGQENYETAEELLETAHHLATSTRGENHTLTMETLFAVGYVYMMKGDQDKLDLALEYFRTVYKARATDPEVGPKREITIQALDGAAHVLIKQKRFAEAVKILKETIEIRTKTLGPDHAVTELSKEALADLEKSLVAQKIKKGQEKIKAARFEL